MAANNEYQPQLFDEEGNPEVRISYNPKDFEPVTPYTEDLQDEYREAQDALKHLRQREAEIKRKAAELEEITRKEEEFSRGRREIVEQIEEYLVMLDREAVEAREVAHDCAEAHQRFITHLNTIRNLRPERWSRDDMRVELDRALRQIEAAEEEVEDSMPLLELLGERGRRGSTRLRAEVSLDGHHAAPEGREGGEFVYWLKAGIAFTIPLMAIVIVVAAMIFYLR